MSADDLALLLVRPARGAGGLDQPIRVGATVTDVLVDLGEPADQPPLAGCQVVYLGQGRMQVSTDSPGPPSCVPSSAADC